MKEKELRLALVCFGGVSLAIYIHGVSKEILKLARASKAIHASPDPLDITRNKYLYPNKDITDIPDTELVYYDVLKSFLPELDLRIIIDTIAGASAGGMNSVFLARAVAHDLNFDHLRHHWLVEADVSRLVGTKKNAAHWSRLFFKPLISILSSKFLGKSSLSTKVKEKLPGLLNHWNLKPPFDGPHLLGLVYNGLKAMGVINYQSLLPRGHKLELFVTLTDFYGYKRTMFLNDPPVTTETEHRHNLKFSYFKRPHNKNLSKFESDFDDRGLASLCFAARATACFPGAFPPAQLRETDQFLQEQGKTWEGKASFLSKNFKEYKQADADPELTSFLDGSILNNKPFDQAIHAIHDRPAFREVSRRIIFIDPKPAGFKHTPDGTPPTIFTTLKGAMSDIPMNEPMRDDLENIAAHNQQVEKIRSVINSVKPSVEKFIGSITSKLLNKITKASDLKIWRNQCRTNAAAASGYSYEAYASLKVRGTVEYLTELISEICDLKPQSAEKKHFFLIMHSWVLRDTLGKSLLVSTPSWTKFLLNFDLNYQKRQLHFLIQELNNQYSHNPDSVNKLDVFKMALYQILETIKKPAIINAIKVSDRVILKQLVKKVAALPTGDNLEYSKNTALLNKNTPVMENILDLLLGRIRLDSVREKIDAVIAVQLNSSWENNFRQSLITNYLGFAFWDVITFSITGSKVIGELNEILVNRISPDDNLVLKSDPMEMPLKGTAMRSFGAFFSREDRENDYLWGRLNGAERLIDMLYEQSKSEGISHKLDVIEIKKKAFSSILEAEKNHLKDIPELFRKIHRRIREL